MIGDGWMLFCSELHEIMTPTGAAAVYFASFNPRLVASVALGNGCGCNCKTTS
jgi:hypothetical protein